MVSKVHAATRLFRSLAPQPKGMAAVGLAAPGAPTRVTFSCNNFPAILVNISTHVGAVLLQPTGSLDMPAGNNKIVWAAKGTSGASFAVTVAGGELNTPISGTLPPGGAGGPRILTVA